MEFDFAANQEVADVQLVPEPFRPAYVKGATDADPWTLNPTYKPFTDLASGLTTSLKASRLEAKAAKASAKPVDMAPLADYGTSPDEIALKVKATIEDLTTKLNAGEKLDPAKMKADIAKGFMTQIAERDATIVSMNTSLNTHLISAEATRAIADLKGVPDLLLPHIEKQVKVINDKGTFKSVVVDKDGDTRLSGATGLPMTIAELVKEMKATTVFGRAFESESATGTGARAGVMKTPVKAGATTTERVLSPLEKIEAGLTANTRGAR